MTTKLKVVLTPADAVKVLKAYDSAPHAWDLVSVPNAISNVISLEVRQDAMNEPVMINLLPDGTWELRTEIAIDTGAPE
jgi:aspartokinase-like uncharacterized kinase